MVLEMGEGCFMSLKGERNRGGKREQDDWTYSFSDGMKKHFESNTRAKI